MRSIRLAALAIGVTLLVPGSLEAGNGGPMLRIVKTNPLTFSGKAFRAGEIVRIVVEPAFKKPRVRKTQSSDAGVFRVAFEGMRHDRCSGGFKVTATGSKGSKVSFTLRQLHCDNAADR